MPFENPRIAELRRRVEADPASIAFAQLAEEYRRAGAYDDAVGVARAGLVHHAGYLSARITLGRALIELGALDEAERELDIVLRSAPDNLAAIRGMGEIYQRRGSAGQALTYYRRALELARHDPELEDAVDALAREVEPERPSAPGLTFAELEQELLGRHPVQPPPALAAPPLAEPTEVGAAAAMPTVAPAPPPEAADVRPEPAPRATAEPAVTPLDALAALSEPEEGTGERIDLDALFENLGGEGDAAPPAVEALLSAPVAPVAPPDPAPAPPPGVPPPMMADDLLAELERELRLVTGQGSLPKVEVVEPPVEVDPEAAVLAELERWLAALAQDRLTRSAGAA
ncbi:MAG: tetratricopeptide repeat protein [Acidobacteriota bacterium]